MCEECCDNCIHRLKLTFVDVECCNCCEDHDLFDPIEEKEEK